MGGAPLDTLEHLRDGDGSSEPGEDVNVIRHPADLHEAPLFTSNHTAEVLVQPVADLGGDQGNPLLRAEHDVIDELCIGPGHCQSRSFGSCAHVSPWCQSMSYGSN